MMEDQYFDNACSNLANANLVPRVEKRTPELDLVNNLDLTKKSNHIVFLDLANLSQKFA